MLVADGVIPVPTVAPKETISPAASPNVVFPLRVVLPSTVRFPLAVTFAPLKVIAVSVLDLISLPLTVRVPPTDTLAASKVIAVVPLDAWISLPPTLMSPAKVVKVLEVRVMLVLLSDALITVTPDISPRTSSFANGLVVPIPTVSKTTRFLVVVRPLTPKVAIVAIPVTFKLANSELVTLIPSP